MLSKATQTEKDKYYVVLILCGIVLKANFIETENKLVVAKGQGKREMGVMQIKGYTFLGVREEVR